MGKNSKSVQTKLNSTTKYDTAWKIVGRAKKRDQMTVPSQGNEGSNKKRHQEHSAA
jgi:hypothetical protein